MVGRGSVEFKNEVLDLRIDDGRYIYFTIYPDESLRVTSHHGEMNAFRTTHNYRVFTNSTHQVIWYVPVQKLERKKTKKTSDLGIDAGKDNTRE
jgi:hypothetical protein